MNESPATLPECLGGSVAGLQCGLGFAKTSAEFSRPQGFGEEYGRDSEFLFSQEIGAIMFELRVKNC